MPNTKSAIRTQRKQDRRQLYNIRVKRAFKGAIRDFKANPSDATLKEVFKSVDKAAKRGVIAKNRAARLKSRLTKYLNKQSKKNAKPSKSKSSTTQ